MKFLDTRFLGLGVFELAVDLILQPTVDLHQVVIQLGHLVDPLQSLYLLLVRLRLQGVCLCHLLRELRLSCDQQLLLASQFSELALKCAFGLLKLVFKPRLLVGA